MVSESPPVTQLLIVADRSQDMDVRQSTLQHGSRAQLNTRAEWPLTNTELAALPRSERPGDSPASWRQRKSGVEVTARGKEEKWLEIGTVGVIVETEIHSDVGERR